MKKHHVKIKINGKDNSLNSKGIKIKSEILSSEKAILSKRGNTL